MLIQLPTETLLADAPAPVLDNQRRPQADSSGVQQGIRQLAAAGQQPMVPDEPFMAPGRGMQAIGRGVMDAGAVLKTVVMEQARAQNDIHVMEGLTAVSTKIAQANTSKDRANPKSWVSHYDEQTGSVLNDEIERLEMSPAAARQFRLQGQNALNHGKITITTDSAQATFAKRDAELESKQYYSMDTGNYEAAEGFMRERIKNGDATEADMARLKTKVIPEHKKQKEREAAVIKFDAHQNEVNQLANTVPAEDVQTYIESIDIDPDSKNRLKDEARRIAKNNTAALADELANHLFSDPDKDPSHIKSEADIDARYANSPFATPTFLQSAKDDLKKINALEAKNIRNGPEGFTKFTAAYTDALKWEPSQDPKKAAEEFREKMTNVRAYVPDDYQGEVTSVLHQKFGSQYEAGGQKKRPEPLQAATKIMTPQFGRMMDPFEAIYARKLKEYNEAPESGKEKAKGEMDIARKTLDIFQSTTVVVQANIEREMASWYKGETAKGKPPTEKEVADHLATLLPDGMSVLGLESLNAPDEDDSVGGASMLPAGTIVNPAPPAKKPTSKKESQNPPLPGDDTFVPSGTGPSVSLFPVTAP